MIWDLLWLIPIVAFCLLVVLGPLMPYEWKWGRPRGYFK